MKINPNLSFLVNNYSIKKNSCLEGSSRSGKTFSCIDFIVWFCCNSNKKSINIIRETYNSFKTTLYPDFSRRLVQYNIDSPFGIVKDIQQWNLFGNTINFLGADTPNKFLGAGCDISWFNEFLDIPKIIFDQQEQRCRELWIADWNPKCTDHFVFDLEKRPDIAFLRTTFQDNQFISDNERKKILSYEPNKVNDNNGTSDDYMWKVYGLGLRASPHGLVFNNIEWITEFPKDIEEIYFGLDFGYTNSPSALVKVGRRGMNLYIEYCFYAPTENADILYPAISKIIGDKFVSADSADPAMITDLRIKGMNVMSVKKFHNSIQFGIDLMKRFKIHVVKNVNSKKEFDNYKWRELGGVILNEPIKENDHGIDAARYACITNFRF